MGPPRSTPGRGYSETRWLMLIFFSLKLALSWAYDIHVSSSSLPGEVIFNASLGEGGWKYEIDSQRSSTRGRELVTVDSYGSVSLRKSPVSICDQANSHGFNYPVYFVIEAKQENPGHHTNYSLIPLDIYIHGENCTSVKSSKLRSSPKSSYTSTQQTSKALLIAIQSEYLRPGACFEQDSYILSLSPFLPQTLAKCNYEYHAVSTPHFRFDNRELKTADHVICLSSPYQIIPLRLQTDCGSGIAQQLVIKLVLYATDSPATLRNYPQLSILHRENGLRRLKRAANTPPSFPQGLYLKYVPEEQAPGFVIDTIMATDPDSGESGRISYSLLPMGDSRSLGMFAIDAASGLLTTTQRLDRESIAIHRFQVIATDNGSPKMSSYASLTIYVEDVNDHAPHFESDLYSRSVSEAISVGATIITVRASDEDEGSNKEIEYTILNPEGPNEAFRINPQLGSITTVQRLDRERHEFYTLHIQASDNVKAGIMQRKTATTMVEITILDENDNKPQFSKSSYTVEIPEDIDIAGNPVILEIHADDADAGENGMVRYSITWGNVGETFAIDEISGQLSLRKPLDYERMTSYELMVRAQDGGSSSNTVKVLVKVIDVNDNTPRFYTSLYQESVLENVAVGYTLIQVLAYDNDAGLNSAIIYSIQDAIPDLPFVIDERLGHLTTSKKLDREVHNRFSFKIVARDQGEPSRSATAGVQITVRDVNDNAPIFEPRIYNEIVSEEALPGTPVVYVTATDADEDENSRVTYSISSGNVRGAFNIISQMGQGLITVAKVLNYKEQSRYILTVTASDPGNMVDTATVFINVSDANTYRPVFQDTPYALRVEEDTKVGTSIFQVVATDLDSGENARITYTMDDNEAFQIDPNTGEISVKHPLDRERVPSYTLSVTATDHGRPAKGDTTDIEITIQDINDNDPKFKESKYSGKVFEDAFVGTSILTISATDDDIGLNGMVRYTFEGGFSGDGDFTLDPTLGILRTNKELDRERMPVYVLKAFAVDRGSPDRSAAVSIEITVQDVNDNAPQFQTSTVELYIKENSPIGSVVDSIQAVDPDEGQNAQVEYSIVGGTDADAFALITEADQPAKITTLVELDYESNKKVYKIVVRARSYHLFSDAIVTIYVEDVNDNMPQLKDFVIIFNNYEDHFPVTDIGRIPAFDPDVKDELRYKFISGNQAGLLRLNENSGYIRLDSRLNSDVPTNGSLQVSVTDGINTVNAQCQLFVRLITQDMLYSSVTLRLNHLTREAFLSPLYHLFITALASILPSTPDNVFVFDVTQDTPEVLNVSFSVRERVEQSKDVFFSPQVLRERVYLQRMLLAKLSTLEVLPFDDNLCVREPCLNFDQCTSTLKFGNATDFVSSDTMLFRPIHPVNTFKCHCPRGFTGMDSEWLCDTEVNLCYSSPCGMNGTCVQREGGYSCICNEGFTGSQCEYQLNTIERYDSCPENICKEPSQCSLLIRGGFRCEVCPSSSNSLCQPCKDLENHTPFCELTTRSFTKGSFLMFPSLKSRHRFSIQLSFATREQNALLFYNGRYNEKHDFVAMEIIEGQVQFSFSLGSEISRVETNVQGGVSDGQWRKVTVTYFNRTATLSVGENCDTELVLKYGSELGEYKCANRARLVLHERCMDVTETCHRFLDLTGPLQLGGLPNLPTDFQVQNADFVGCIKDVYIDNKFLDLNDHVWNNGTKEGCPQKQRFCHSNPCANQGTCEEAWDTYQCACTDGWGGKDCSQKIDPTVTLSGDGYLSFTNHRVVNAKLPWFNGISFRTRQKTAHLMSVELGQGTRDRPKIRVNIEIVNGYIHYFYTRKTMVLDSVHVNDGKWHYLEIRWLTGQQLIMALDYGQIQKVHQISDYVTGEPVGVIHVGGLPVTLSSSVNNFQGCIKDIRVGNMPGSTLTNAERHGKILDGCQANDPCGQGDACPANSQCRDTWKDHQCTCNLGRAGPECTRVCENYNPCEHGAQCRDAPSSRHGYTCNCAEGYTGSHCVSPRSQLCPATWWGSPICGPCNCDVERGFAPNCNKTTGECLCKEYHYRPSQDRCLACDCYEVGSFGLNCDPTSGQCKCRNGVIGRRCDSCPSKFAEVTRRGCEVVYDSCPRAYASGVWWERTVFGGDAAVDCPQGTYGKAFRHCNETDGWMGPNLFDCTSEKFVDLRRQLLLLDSGAWKINTFVAKNLMLRLNEATEATKAMYGMDINITSRMAIHILQYENTQSGLNLTHTQDRNFLQNLVNSIGRILKPQYRDMWNILNQEGAASTVELMRHLEAYTVTLARNMPQIFTPPFDIVHDNIMLGLDTILKGNFTSAPIPKYNNKVKNPDMFDPDTQVLVPSAIAMDSTLSGSGTTSAKSLTVSYVMYKTLGELLPKHVDTNIRILYGVPLKINSPVFTLNVVDGNKVLGQELSEPLLFDYRQLEVNNRTSPQCVYWHHDNSKSGGKWSSEGCELVNRRSQGGHRYVTCQCNHLSSFGILMDESSLEHPRVKVGQLQIVTYVGLALGLACLVVAMVMFCCIRSFGSNINSIHMNIIFCLFVSLIVFLAGINQVKSELACKIIAILLHFFYLCVFAWMFVEALHLYRMLTEIRDINTGAMKFYYLIGYVIPGITVSLAVGLRIEDYDNKEFCWISTNDLLVWSFAGPICVSIALTMIVFLMALRASCNPPKKSEDDVGAIKYMLKAAIIFAPLVSLAWVFGLLSVNDNVLAFHYLFAVLSFLQGLFILLAYVGFNKQVTSQLKYQWYRLHGRKDLDETISPSASRHNRSALSYQNDSYEGALNRLHIGVSTTSTTSHSSKSSGALYHPDPYYMHSSTSTSNHGPTVIGEFPPNAGIAPYGYDKGYYPREKKILEDPDTGEKRHKKHRDVDSDSELSGVDHPDMELASSHSSDDEELNYGWNQKKKGYDLGPEFSPSLGKGLAPSQGKRFSPSVPRSTPPAIPPYPSWIPPQVTAPPPYASVTPRKGGLKWPGEGPANTSAASDTEVKTPRRVQISDKPPETIAPMVPPKRGDLIYPPERSDSLTKSPKSPHASLVASPPRDRVAILTHNGSISESESWSTDYPSEPQSSENNAVLCEAI